MKQVTQKQIEKGFKIKGDLKLNILHNYNGSTFTLLLNDGKSPAQMSDLSKEAILVVKIVGTIFTVKAQMICEHDDRDLVDAGGDAESGPITITQCKLCKKVFTQFGM